MPLDHSSEAQRARSRKRWTKSVAERFAEKYEIVGDHWIWTGAKSGGGYGVFRLNGKQIGAHVASFLLAGRTLAPGQYVLHSCDIRPCVNPACLFPGSQADNVADMIAKGRQATGERCRHGSQVGELNHGSKLSEEVVGRIRQLSAAGERQADIMRETGATRANVWAIVHGKSWTHVGAAA